MEDDWANLTIGEAEASFEMLGRCQRCSMVCVNQATAEKSQEPFVTLAKTRKFDNKVYFGEHMCLVPGSRGKVFIKAGDKVKAFVSPT
jgi:molybdenum cofactor sulfurtransferase